jgi:prophage DNA circulation protein
MAIARDWLKTLWAASYKGTPFFVEKDNEDGSRRIVEHEFPMRDIPYLEDLGEGVRHYAVTAYVVGDGADGQASSVMQICATRGPGILVLPTHGPILVRCLTFERDRSKDKHGYIGHSLKFSREGAASAIASIASLANTVFVNADVLALTAAVSFAKALLFVDQPDYVRDAAVEAVAGNAATLEAVRTSAQVDPDVSARQREEIQSIFDAAGDVTDQPVVGAATYQTAIGQQTNSPAVDLAARLMASARELGDGMAPEDAIATFEETFVGSQVVVPAPLYVTPGTLAEVRNQEAGYQAIRLAALATYSEAIARVSLPDRPAAITLRANVAEHFESELLIINAADIELAHAVARMRDAVIDYLSRSILDLAPVITISANLVMPSLFWAWRLYQNPNRAFEIAGRNRLPHPSFVPVEFEALGK